MNKKINIYDYKDKPKSIIIKNFENIIEIYCEVLSGDEVLTVVYKDGEEKVFDAGVHRYIDFYDGVVDIPLNKIDEFASITHSNDMLRHFENM